MCLATRRFTVCKRNLVVYWLIIMSNHCPNLVAIGSKERLLRHIRCRYPGGYRFARPDRSQTSYHKKFYILTYLPSIYSLSGSDLLKFARLPSCLAFFNLFIWAFLKSCNSFGISSYILWSVTLVSFAPVFWMSRSTPPKETCCLWGERCLTSKRRLRRRLENPVRM